MKFNRLNNVNNTENPHKVFIIFIPLQQISSLYLHKTDNLKKGFHPLNPQKGTSSPRGARRTIITVTIIVILTVVGGYVYYKKAYQDEGNFRFNSTPAPLCKTTSGMSHSQFAVVGILQEKD